MKCVDKFKCGGDVEKEVCEEWKGGSSLGIERTNLSEG